MQTQSTGIVSTSLDWILHPQFADTDPLDWFIFAAVLIILGYLWSKTVRQTLEAI